jgi:SAM-dependent methyltransferase
MTRETYASTRRGWAAIWRDRADIESELRTLTYPRTRLTTSLYVPYLPRQGLILEAGCGLGKEIIQLSDMGYELIGVDYVEAPLHQIRSRWNDCRLIAADVHDLPFRDETFRGYLSFGVVEHFEFGPEPALREASRVLRKGGALILTVPYPSLVWRLAQIKKHLFRQADKKDDACFATTYHVSKLKQYLDRTGFEVRAAYPTSHSFTLWGTSGLFRGKGYYETSALADWLGLVFARVLPWSMCFASLLIAEKRGDEKRFDKPRGVNKAQR